MAGKIKQVSELEFRTKGASKVEKETERVGKAQTRLGQTSASAGRQFSSQANGLGGLVRVLSVDLQHFSSSVPSVHGQPPS